MANFDTLTTKVSEPVETDGEIVFTANAGAEYVTGNSVLGVPALQEVFSEADDEISVEVDGDKITVTYRGAREIPTASEVNLQIDIEGGDGEGVSWGDISGKPQTFPPSNISAITSAGGNLSIPAGSIQDALQALADAIDPAASGGGDDE